ncbi:MAG: hypothetical protein IJX63_00725, partial [Lachnospiraceae bacterium]|nr:hypothetical protein [Lachnospiraceae bacterium]
MKKGRLLLAVIALVFGLTGCGDNALEGDCKCTVALLDVPKELEMLDENLLEQFEISVELENIYSEKTMEVELTAENRFCEELKIQPGTYLVKYYYAGPSNLVPIEVEVKQDKIELTRENPQKIDVVITNQSEFADWAWSCEATREILEAGAFSHKIQFEGQLIDVTEITDYVEFQCENKVSGYDKATISNGEKGVTIVVQNTKEGVADWTECKLVQVTFRKNNVIWGQGAFVGMNVAKAVHAKDGLYG